MNQLIPTIKEEKPFNALTIEGSNSSVQYSSRIKIKFILYALIFTLMFRFFLDFFYVTYIKNIWGVEVYTYGFELHKIILSWTVLIPFTIMLIFVTDKDNFSSKVILLLFLVAFVPGTTILAYANVSIEFFYSFLLYWLVLLGAQLVIPHFKLMLKADISNLAYPVIVFMFVFVILYIWIFLGQMRLYLPLGDVYELRNVAYEFSMPRIIRYIYSSSRSVIPLLLTFSLFNKKYFYAIILLAAQYLSYVSDGSKSTLFSLAAALAIYFILPKKFKERVFPLTVVASSLAWAEIAIVGRSKIIDLGIRRVLYLTSIINVWYFDFFKNKPKDLFSQSFLRIFGFTSVYQQDIKTIIGDLHYSGSYVNNGLFTDAYYNMGLVGLLVMPLFIVLALRALEACAGDIPQRAYISAVISSAWYFQGSSFFTIMLTHGYVLMCLTLLLLQNYKNKRSTYVTFN